MARRTTLEHDHFARRCFSTLLAAAVLAAAPVTQAADSAPRYAQPGSARSNPAPSKASPAAPAAPSQPRRAELVQPDAFPKFEPTQPLRPSPWPDQSAPSPGTGLQWHEAIQGDCIKIDFLARVTHREGTIFT